MFEVNKFSKMFPLFKGLITDKNKLKELIKDSEFLELYKKNESNLEYIKEKLTLIYGPEVTRETFLDLINNPNNISKYYNALQAYLLKLKEYNESYEILKEISWDKIKNSYSSYSYKLNKIVQTIIFNHYYQQQILYNGIDFKLIFERIDNDAIRKVIIDLLRNNNINNLLDFLDESELNEAKIAEDFINEVFSKELRDYLGENNFRKLIKYYIKNNQRISFNKSLMNIIVNHKYQLLKDFLLGDTNYLFSKYDQNTNVNTIFDMNVEKWVIQGIINNYIFNKGRLDSFLYKRLSSLIDAEVYDNFTNKFMPLIGFLKELSKESPDLNKLHEIYNYAYKLSDEDRLNNDNLVNEINKEMNFLIKKDYSKTIDEFSTIKSKASYQDGVQVYELRDNEPFRFLISVMHNRARNGLGTNMYSRPAHILTINDPSNFTKDLQNGSEIISCSLIDNTYIETFVGYNSDIIYVFDNIEPEDIIGISSSDGAFPPHIEENQELFDGEPVSSNMIVTKSMYSNSKYNEIAITRKLKNGEKRLPSAILCYNEVNEASIKHAKYFNIPIIIINTRTYEYLPNLDKNNSRT